MTTKGIVKALVISFGLIVLSSAFYWGRLISGFAIAFMVWSVIEVRERRKARAK